jgi:hypothetical protein
MSSAQEGIKGLGSSVAECLAALPVKPQQEVIIRDPFRCWRFVAPDNVNVVVCGVFRDDAETWTRIMRQLRVKV